MATDTQCVVCEAPLPPRNAPGRRRNTCSDHCARQKRLKINRESMRRARAAIVRTPGGSIKVRVDLAANIEIGISMMQTLRSRSYREISSKVFEERGRQLRPGEFVRTEGGRFVIYRD